MLENKEKGGFIEIGCGCYGDRCPSERRKLKIRSTTSFLSLFIFLLSNSIFFFFFYSRRSFLRLTFLLTFYATLFYVFLADKVYATQKMSLDFFPTIFFFFSVYFLTYPLLTNNYSTLYASQGEKYFASFNLFSEKKKNQRLLLEDRDKVDINIQS